MNKDKILRKSEDFTEIINQGKKIKNQYFSIFYQPKETTLYGITVPKKYGKAHIRNKIKRQIKNIIITNEKNIQNNINYVIIIKTTYLLLFLKGVPYGTENTKNRYYSKHQDAKNSKTKKLS